MHTKINEPISVVSIFDQKTGLFRPAGVRWHNRFYQLHKFGYHHKIKQGSVLVHYFTAASDTLSFKLKFETDHLIWRVEEIYSED